MVILILFLLFILLALFVIKYKKQIVESGCTSLATSFKYIYLVLMMGLFAFYCGFVYNEFLGIPLNLFGSCYTIKDELSIESNEFK